MDPEFQLLPLHYSVDPGCNFAWGKDESNPVKLRELDMDMEQKLNLIRRYLDVERIPVASLGVLGEV